MFVRFLELTIKPEKKTEFFTKMREEVLPILRKYTGFVDTIPLEIENEPTKIYAMSLWHDRTDAEKYHKESFAKVTAIYEPFLTMPVIVKLCHVDETIFKKAVRVAA